MRGLRIVSSHGAFVFRCSSHHLIYGLSLNLELMLIISNPVSGDKTGPQFVNDFVIPLLNKHDVAFTLKTTNAPGHAGDLATEYLTSLGNVKSAVILISGGDGTIHEVVNAVYADLTSSNPKAPIWPELQLVLVNSGTASALYHSVYPIFAGPDILRAVNETLPEADYDAANRLQSVVAYLTGTGATRPLALARNTVIKRDGSIKHSLISVMVGSTALHANLMHTSESLRATIPGVERYAVAAKRNLTKWSHAKVRLISTEEYPLLMYDVRTDFMKCQPIDHRIDGPFAYFLSTLNIDRLEADFMITPLISKIKPSLHTMDVVIVRPLRCPQVKGDTADDRQRFAQALMGCMAAARGGMHTLVHYPRDPNSKETVWYAGNGRMIVEYYRCSGWEWVPVSTCGSTKYYLLSWELVGGRVPRCVIRVCRRKDIRTCEG